LTSALLGAEWSASRHYRFIPGEWVDPGTGLDDTEKVKFFNLTGLKLRPLGHPARIQSLLTTDYATAVHIPETIPGHEEIKEEKYVVAYEKH
jgi:hypothetical protein